jgi:hypothetical protein
MALPIKFSPGVQEHIDAGHFTIYPKPFMGGTRIWFWTKGKEIMGGSATSRIEAEEAAVAWYEQATKIL